MFAPYSPILPAIDPIERSRIESGRPASRSEILERYLRDNRLDGIGTMSDQTLPAGTAQHSQPVQPLRGQVTPFPLSRVRRTISRALMSAAERIGPEAA